MPEENKKQYSIWVTPVKFKLFRKGGRVGQDAYILYSFLQELALEQGVSVRADDVFIMQELGWGYGKLKKAKALLKRMGLIEYSQPHTKKGTFEQVKYILVRTKRQKVSKRQQQKELSTGGMETIPAVASPVVRKTGGTVSASIPKHIKDLKDNKKDSNYNSIASNEEIGQAYRPYPCMLKFQDMLGDLSDITPDSLRTHIPDEFFAVGGYV